MRVCINFDLRNPARWHRPTDRVFGQTLELIQYADEVGIDLVSVSEHHLWDDGYLPQGLTFLAAAAARTKQIRLMTGVMLLPLHHPVDVAEQVAVVDAISGGRVELAMGVGYRPAEYKLYGLDIRDRYKLYQEKVRRLRELWSTGGVTPAPIQSSIPLWGAFRGPKFARVAGELGLGLYTVGLELDTWQPYVQGWTSVSDRQGGPRLASTVAIMAVDDPEAALHTLADRLEDHFGAYEQHATEATMKREPVPLSAARRVAIGAFPEPEDFEDWMTTVGDKKLPMGCSLLQSKDAAEQILRRSSGLPLDHVKFWSTVGGQIDDLAYRNVELIAKEVKPLLNQPPH